VTAGDTSNNKINNPTALKGMQHQMMKKQQLVRQMLGGNHKLMGPRALGRERMSAQKSCKQQTNKTDDKWCEAVAAMSNGEGSLCRKWKERILVSMKGM
jgi:hypothetical protein